MRKLHPFEPIITDEELVDYKKWSRSPNSKNYPFKYFVKKYYEEKHLDKTEIYEHLTCDLCEYYKEQHGWK